MQFFTIAVLFTAIAQTFMGSAVLVGNVTDDQGYPVTNTTVRAYRAGYDDNGNFTVLHEAAKQPRAAQTDSNGEFRIVGLESGEYFVAVEPVMLRSDRVSDARVPSTTYYPGTLNPSLASTVRVRVAEEHVLGNIKLLSARLATVHLHILNSTAEDPERKLVSWSLASLRNPSLVPGQAMLPGLTHAIQVEGDDVQITNLPPGSYGFSVTLNREKKAFVERTVINVNELDVYREIEVRPSPRVTGAVVFEDESGSATPLADVQVIMVTDGSSTSLHGVSGSNGRFSINGVTQRNFRLRFLGLPDDAYVDSASDGNLDALLTPWALTRDVELYVVVKPKGARASGTVADKDGKAVPEATVVLVPDRRNAGARYFLTTSDASGAFALRGIPPGSYQLFAWLEMHGEPYRNSDFMRRYERYGVTVTLKPAEEVRHVLTLSVD
jgi:hypothetical protein